MAILVNGVETFEQIVNNLSTDGTICNLVKNAREVSEKKAFKIYNLHMYIVQVQGQITPKGQNFDYN